MVTVTPEDDEAVVKFAADGVPPLTSFVIEAGMVGVRVISGLALVKSMAVSTFLSDKSSALLKSEALLETTADETCERAEPPFESWRLSKSAANSRETAASSFGFEAVEAACVGLLSTLMVLLNFSKASIEEKNFKFSSHFDS